MHWIFASFYIGFSLCVSGSLNEVSNTKGYFNAILLLMVLLMLNYVYGR